MDVTPPPGMFKAMQTFVDSVIGEAPAAIETSPAAERRREERKTAMDFLHNLVRLSMRMGVARHYQEMGWPTIMDDIRPNPIKKDVPVSDNIVIPQ